MDGLAAFASIIPLSLTSGVNLYATILVIGLVYQLGWLGEIPARVEPLISLPVLCIAGVLYVVEFVADKVQFVDNTWDAIHTVIRPLGAIGVVGGFLVGLDPTLATALALAAGGTAFTAHSGKAGFRFMLNTLSPAENASNVTVSLLEDFAVAALVVLALMFPYAALIVALIILLVIITVLPMMLRWAWFRLRSIFAALSANVRKIQHSETLPSTHLAVLNGVVPSLSISCRVQGVAGANGRSGYLSLHQETLYFTYRRWWKTQRWSLPQAQLTAAQLRRRMLADVITIYMGKQHIEFVFYKDRAPLVEQAARQIGAAEISKQPKAAQST